MKGGGWIKICVHVHNDLRSCKFCCESHFAFNNVWFINIWFDITKECTSMVTFSEQLALDCNYVYPWTMQECNLRKPALLIVVSKSNHTWVIFGSILTSKVCIVALTISFVTKFMSTMNIIWCKKSFVNFAAKTLNRVPFWNKIHFYVY